MNAHLATALEFLEQTEIHLCHSAGGGPNGRSDEPAEALLATARASLDAFVDALLAGAVPAAGLQTWEAIDRVYASLFSWDSAVPAHLLRAALPEAIGELSLISDALIARRRLAPLLAA